MTLRLLRLLRRQDGVSLIMAIGVLAVLSLSGTTLIYYSSANARSSEYSKDNSDAYVLAEAGLNEMMSILANTSNNALNEHLLPTTTHSYEGGTVTWSGVLKKDTAVWTLTSIGRIKNPTGVPANDVERKLTAKVPVTPTTTQPLNNPSWNYIMSTQVTGGECDMRIGNTVTVRTNLYVFGNLCLEQQGRVLKGETNVTSLVVNGKVTQYTNQNTVGQNGQPIWEVNVKLGCKWSTNPFYLPCIQGDDTRIYASTFRTDGATLVGPNADFNAWYLNAAPGPYFPCTVSSGSVPVFDNPVAASNAPDAEKLAYKNNNQTVVNLTPSNSSYSCKVAGAGEITWNHSTKLLTVSGTIYIDGDAQIEFATPTTIQYNGQATLYLSGSLMMKNVKLCGGLVGTNCDFAAWNPNTEMLVLVADGDNRQPDVDSGFSMALKNTNFQGALYATKKLALDTTSKVDGPMVGSEVVLGQSVSTNDFPNITTVPAGMPGNPTVYAQPNSPELYSG